MEPAAAEQKSRELVSSQIPVSTSTIARTVTNEIESDSVWEAGEDHTYDDSGAENQEEDEEEDDDDDDEDEKDESRQDNMHPPLFDFGRSTSSSSSSSSSSSANPTLSEASSTESTYASPRMLSNNRVSNTSLTGIEPKFIEMIEYMLRYSFSKSLNQNAFWVGLIHHSLIHIINFIKTEPKEVVNMKNILKAISSLVGQHLNVINRKKEEILSFEATIVLAFMQTTYFETLYMEKEEFYKKYPEFTISEIVTELEKAKLFEFCNCVRVVQELIPAKNNKEHILDLVSRLTEGFAVRRVTGTGMTVETRNRYVIIHREGGLIPRKRTDKIIDKEEDEDVNEAGMIRASDVCVKKKRGRPLSHRSDEPVTYDIKKKNKLNLMDKNLLEFLMNSQSQMLLNNNLQVTGGGAGGGAGGYQDYNHESIDSGISLNSQQIAQSLLYSLYGTTNLNSSNLNSKNSYQIPVANQLTPNNDVIDIDRHLYHQQRVPVETASEAVTQQQLHQLSSNNSSSGSLAILPISQLSNPYQTIASSSQPYLTMLQQQLQQQQQQQLLLLQQEQQQQQQQQRQQNPRFSNHFGLYDQNSYYGNR